MAYTKNFKFTASLVPKDYYILIKTEDYKRYSYEPFNTNIIFNW